MELPQYALSLSKLVSFDRLRAHHLAMRAELFEARALGQAQGTSLPARQTQLLRLLLDILVIKSSALLRSRLPSTDLDADLLKRRALDRRLELQRRACLARLEVGLGVLRNLADVSRQLAVSGEEWAGGWGPLGIGVTAWLRGHEFDEVLGCVELLALHGLGDVQAITWPDRHAEAGAIAARDREEADVLGLAWRDVLNVRRNPTQLGVMRALALGESLDAVIQLGRREIFVEVARLTDLLDVLEPSQRCRSVRILRLASGVLRRKVGHLGLNIVIVAQNEQLGCPGLPVGLDNRSNAVLLDGLVVLHELVPGLRDLESELLVSRDVIEHGAALHRSPGAAV